MERDPEVTTVTRLRDGRLVWWRDGDFRVWDGTHWSEPEPDLTVDRLMDSQLLTREEIQRLKESGIFSEA